eukprot:SAG11_NODE_308_length_10943_cov_6.679609_4_plen_122_part_00
MCASGDRTVLDSDGATVECVQTLPGDSNSVWYVVVLGSGQIVYASGDKTVNGGVRVDAGLGQQLRVVRRGIGTYHFAGAFHPAPSNKLRPSSIQVHEAGWGVAMDVWADSAIPGGWSVTGR